MFLIKTSKIFRKKCDCKLMFRKKNLNGIMILFLLFLFPVVCLKELKIFVPEAVIMGNAATLTCQYDLDNVRHSLNLFILYNLMT